jgi:hypothetical protein
MHADCTCATGRAGFIWSTPMKTSWKRKLLTAQSLLAAAYVLRPTPVAGFNCTTQEYAEECRLAQQVCDMDCVIVTGCDGNFCMNFICQYDPNTGCYSGNTNDGCSSAYCNGQCFSYGQACQSEMDCCESAPCVYDGSRAYCA